MEKGRENSILIFATEDWGNELDTIFVLKCLPSKNEKDSFLRMRSIKGYAANLRVPRQLWERYGKFSEDEITELEAKYPDLAKMRQAIEESVGVVRQVKKLEDSQLDDGAFVEEIDKLFLLLLQESERFLASSRALAGLKRSGFTK